MWKAGGEEHSFFKQLTIEHGVVALSDRNILKWLLLDVATIRR